MKTIVLDAGHGLNTAGKRIPSASYVAAEFRGTREWSLNNRICNYVENYLTGYSDKVNVIRSDDITGATDVSLAARKQVAKSHSADMFISVHHNAGINGRSGGGVVVYSRRNPGNTLKEAARHLYKYVVDLNGNKGNRATPVAESDFTVIKGNAAPVALLIECGFMDAPADIPKIMSQEYARQTAKGIADFIIDELSLKEAGDTLSQLTYTVKPGDTLWSVAKYQLHNPARWKEIQELNGLKTTVIRSGQVLKLPDIGGLV